MRVRFGLIALATTVIALAITASASAATRADFVAEADPICKAGIDQEYVIFTQADQQVKRAEKHTNFRKRKARRRLAKRVDRIYAAAFGQYIAIERGVNSQLATLTPAPPDESLVQVWIRARGELLDTYERFSNLRSIKKPQQFFILFTQFIGLLYETNDIVRDFGFQYCAGQLPPIVAGVSRA